MTLISCDLYNRIEIDEEEKKLSILHELFPSDEFVEYRTMESPFYIDNAKEVSIGKTFIQAFILPLSVDVMLILVIMFSLDPTVSSQPECMH